MNKQVRPSRLKALAASLRDILGETWRQGTGKASLILMVILIVIATYAAVVMPPNFRDAVWDNIEVQGENPSLVPPEWTKHIGVPYAPHAVVMLSELTDKLDLDNQIYEFNYTTTYNLEHEVLPQGIIAKGYELLVVAVGNYTIGPRCRILISRPDGITGLYADTSVTLTVSPELAWSRSSAIVKLSESENIKPDLLYKMVIKYANESGLLILKNKVYYIEFNTANGTFLEPVGNVASMLIEDFALKPSKYIFGEISNIDASYEFIRGQWSLQRVTTSMKPLVGSYNITISCRYTALPPAILSRIQSLKPFNSIKLIVKGSVYGFMGTDASGRDLALGLLYGFPLAIAIGFFVAGLTSLIGLIAGVVSGYYGGIVDEVIQRIVDIMGNIPLLPILIIIAMALMVTYAEAPLIVLMGILIVLIAFGWGALAIIVRAMTLSIKEEPYIEAARALGASDKRIIFKHIIPQVIPYIVANLVFSVPGAILTEAGLSVLGIRHGYPTWGAILSEAYRYMRVAMEALWWVLPPGILISITSLTFVLLGMALEKVVEPRLRSA
ncbi:MAG: ABC transporter permease [Sulfolobales archaeon]|nr:ABC transporter permease [Sulfolobales archaeon]